MTLRVLPFPVSPKKAAVSGMQPGSEMHCRFEARRLTAFLLGPRPRVKILQIAWLDKRRHLDRFLDDYYAAHKCLPRGRHDLGVTENHGLWIGVLDFDRIRAQLRLALRREQQRTRRWSNLGAVLGKIRWRPFCAQGATPPIPRG